MTRFWPGAAALAVCLILSACNGGGNGGGNSFLSLIATMLVPNVTTGTNFSFDIAAVDSAAGRMYFTDRNNKSVDVIDIKTNTLLKQIKAEPKLAKMELIRQSRLSVAPVRDDEWQTILGMAGQ